MAFSRLLTNLCADDLIASRDFYVELLGCTVKYDSDWYVQLGSGQLELGIIRRDHELVPSAFQTQPTGMYITFVVPDVDATYEKARAMQLEILQTPRDEFYGQRRFLTRDPSGCLIDICSPIGAGAAAG